DLHAVRDDLVLGDPFGPSAGGEAGDEGLVPAATSAHPAVALHVEADRVQAVGAAAAPRDRRRRQACAVPAEELALERVCDDAVGGDPTGAVGIERDRAQQA